MPVNGRHAANARTASLRWGVRVATGAAVAMTSLSLAGCEGPQSALVPRGPAAASILNLFWWMLAGACVIWLLVVAAWVYAIFIRSRAHDYATTRWWIIGGGVAAPTVVLTVLLFFALSGLPPLIADAPEGSPVVHVDGVRWWFRVRYETPDGEIESANEVRMPVGEPVQFLLHSDDVIHSFWVPALGGKLDMIPGRVNRLMLQADEATHVRGACAEYCGESHAKMNFEVVSMPREEFDRWLAGQAEASREPRTPLTRRGADLFQSAGCGACHVVRGTSAAGPVGPDLTHFGSRLTVAGVLANTPENVAHWIRDVDSVKPGAEMPSFDHLSDDQLKAIAAYLKGL